MWGRGPYLEEGLAPLLDAAPRNDILYSLLLLGNVMYHLTADV